MIRKVIVVTSEPFPEGMAGTNRIISLSKGFLSNDIMVEVVGISRYYTPGYHINNSVSGVHEGIVFSSIFSSLTRIDNFFYRAITEFFKPFLLFFYCLGRVNNETLIFFYSSETLPALSLSLINKIKKSFFVKEETEHPEIRVRNNNIIVRYLYFKIHYKLFDAVTVITQQLYDFFKKDLKFRKLLILTPMVIDFERFIIKDNTEKQASPIKNIVFAGVLDDKKEGIGNLINAFAQTLKKFPKITLSLYGEADESQLASYKGMCADLGITDNVLFGGYKSRIEMNEILINASLLVFVRPFSLQATYGFSTKLGEYLATGNPVLATEIGEVGKYLINNENAFLCKPEVNSISNMMCMVFSDYKHAVSIGLEGRNCALKYFNNKLETKNMIDKINSFV